MGRRVQPAPGRQMTNRDQSGLPDFMPHKAKALSP